MTLNIKLENMSEGHIEHIVKIENECFSEPWTYNGLLSELNNENSYFIVATINNTVVGYAGMHCILGDCYITNVAVLLPYRKMHIGTTLVKSLIEYANSKNFNFISLEVRISNEVAYDLYKTLGFVEVGIRKNFYKKPVEDAIIMNYIL